MRRNLAAVGLLVLVAGALFLWGYFYLLGDPVLRGGDAVVVLLENGGGLKRGDRVQLQGVAIGSVRGVELRKPGGVAVTLNLNGRLELPADTRALVRGDVFGAHTVDLVPGAALVRLERGDTIRGEAALPLPELATELGGRAQKLLVSADSLLSPATLASMKATAATLPATATELHGALAEFHRAAEALRKSAESVEGAEMGPALAGTLEELQGSARAFSAASASLERSLDSFASVMGKIDRGEGTLGRLVNDSLLYRDLQTAAREMGALAADIREKPHRYFKVSVF